MDTGDRISARIESRDIGGQVAVGNDIRQENYERASRTEVTDADLAQVHALFEVLKRQVREEAPADDQPAMLERVDELEAAVTADEPKLSTIEYVRDWFAERLPKLGEAVTGVVLSPIVSKLVATGGNLAAAELRRRLGG